MLEGVRIVSLAEQLPGPYATSVLADLGAEVVMVERPAGGDPTRAYPGHFQAVNRGKFSVALDLKTDAGRAGLDRLLSRADALLVGFRPGVMDRLGIPPDDLGVRFPRLIIAEMSGYGQTGPMARNPGHDIGFQGLAGVFAEALASGGVPDKPVAPWADLVAALHAAIALLAALVRRSATGRGCRIDLAITDALVSALAFRLLPAMTGQPTFSGTEPAYGLFYCRDGTAITIGIGFEDDFWQRLCHAAGMEDVAALPRARRLRDAAALRERIAGRLATWDRAEAGARLDAAGVPWAPAHGLDQVARDPQIAGRGLFLRTSGSGTDETGEGGDLFVRQPALFDGTGYFGNRRPVPSLGQDTAHLLARWDENT